MLKTKLPKHVAYTAIFVMLWPVLIAPDLMAQDSPIVFDVAITVKVSAGKVVSVVADPADIGRIVFRPGDRIHVERSSNFPSPTEAWNATWSWDEKKTSGFWFFKKTTIIHHHTNATATWTPSWNIDLVAVITSAHAASDKDPGDVSITVHGAAAPDGVTAHTNTDAGHARVKVMLNPPTRQVPRPPGVPGNNATVSPNPPAVTANVQDGQKVASIHITIARPSSKN